MKVEHSEWAAPIVAVNKQGKKVRLCADLSTGLNAAWNEHKYPLPLPDELFSEHNGGEKFSNIDLEEAYAQIVLDEKDLSSSF